MLARVYPEQWHPPSPPLSPPEPARQLKPPRGDLLTHEQADQLRVELLAGCEVPKHLPRSITHAIAIADTGCARSMGNHPDQFKRGSIYDRESPVSGAAGAFKCKQRGHLAFPMEADDVGLRLWSEKDSIVNKACAYVLLSLGRMSRESGLSLAMPA